MFKQKIIMFIYFYIYVSISFFLSPFLITTKNFIPTTVGYLTTISLIFLIISFFLNGMLADKIKSNKSIISFNLIMTFISLILIVGNSNKLIISSFYILSWTSFLTITSQIDGLVVSSVNSGKYSMIRSYGSYGAALSYLINSLSYSQDSIVNNLIFNLGLIIVLIMLVSSLKENKYVGSIKLSEYSLEVKNMFNNKIIRNIMIITFLTYGTLSADDSYQVLYNTQVVMISAIVMGIVGFISILSEGTFMMLHAKVIKKFGIISTLNISVGVLFLIYITRFMLYTSPLIINIGSIFMGLFIGFFVPTAIKIISTNVNESTQNTFLSLYQIMIRIGGVVIGLLTTLFLDLTGSLQNIYFLHSILIAISFIFINNLRKEIEWR